MEINEITEEDKQIIYNLYFEEMYDIEEIERKMKKKYKYSQISNLLRKKIGEYNGYTSKVVKRKVSWYSLEHD